MVEYKLGEKENLEIALNKFKKMVIKEGVLGEVKKRAYFQKPSNLKHEKNKTIKRKQLLQLKKLNKVDHSKE